MDYRIRRFNQRHGLEAGKDSGGKEAATVKPRARAPWAAEM